MPSAKDIHIRPISSRTANAFIRRVHYSGKVAPNSQLHFGVFLNERLEGALQLGPSIDKRKLIGLVRDTEWNNFIELNRMAFSEVLPRNSESRALGIVFRMMRKHYPHIEWVVSFADATQCGDGTIYRASGFVLTQIHITNEFVRLPSGEIKHRLALNTNSKLKAQHGGGAWGQKKWADKLGGTTVTGHQLRYIYFLNPAARDRLTTPVLPFNLIDEMAAGMYKGQKIVRSS